jgi:hypothetical protein
VISWRVLAIDPMLIQSFVGKLGAQLVARAFGFGSAKAGSVGLRLLLRLISLSALLEALQVDHIPHRRLHHADNGAQEADRASPLSIAIASAAKPAFSFAEHPLVGSAIMNSSYSPSDSIKKNIALWKNVAFSSNTSALYHVRAQRQ